ncbi:MAG TPA: uracil-DNA glycosylase [Gemmatimonadaceae bacterium]
MDAKDSLRRYLEQRRELGESELVLDSMSVDEAMKLLGASKTAPRAKAPETTDWRAAVRAAGGAPEARPSMGPPEIPDKPAPVHAQPLVVHVPSTQGDAPPTSAGSPLEDIPVGIVVGGTSRAIFDDPAFKLDSLDAIAETVATCTRCPLYASAKNPVPGTGNPNADFMIVGEAPGANEDEQGVPFVGPAGQLLTKIIGAINLSRDDVFIANVLKHRPPGNRNPLPEEVAACSPYLVRQIELVRPKVILALGTFAAQTLLETKTTIGKLRGQIHRYYGVPLIVTYHPAALLRNPAWKRPTWEDVQLARRILDRPDAPPSRA